MKTVILTGLRNEVDMRTGAATGFGLIFNDGGLHIPVTQDVMEAVVQYAFNEGDEEQVEEQDPLPPRRTPMPQNETVEVPESDEDIPQL